jgi:hypothetical protein
MDPVADDEAEAIIVAIRQAFSGVRRGEVTLHEAIVIDSYGADAERQEARSRDVEIDWQHVRDEDIEECETALCFLDPVSWRYYIPAYMIWSLSHFRVNNSIVSDFTIYTFELSDRHDLREYGLSRFESLSQSQAGRVSLSYLHGEQRRFRRR